MMEKSKKNPNFPAHYKGYDIDALMEKEDITREEGFILTELYDTYEEEADRKKREQFKSEIEKAKAEGNIVLMPFVDPGLPIARALNERRTYGRLKNF